MRDFVTGLFAPRAPERYRSIGPGRRNLCPELGRWYRLPHSAKPERCKALPVAATKAEREALHVAKMVRKGYRRV